MELLLAVLLLTLLLQSMRCDHKPIETLQATTWGDKTLIRQPW